ncbi:MAG: helix-turn-helix domain-containing protein [Bacilli bacterium]|nr:helix-turn-helix domain-containing protein [Bacilli bacterium]
MICNKCKGINVREENYHHVLNIKNHIIEYDAPRFICKDCRGIVPDKELDLAATIKGYDLYSAKYGIPKEDIILLRKKLNLSQELFAKIIGCAKKTLVSYEVGYSIPNDIYMGVLKLLKADNRVILELLSANKDSYSKEEYNKLINRINLKNNNSIVDKDELVNNIILYFSENGVSKTKVMCLLFLSEYNYYMKYKKSLTNLDFINNSNYLNIFGFEDTIINLINNKRLQLIYDVSSNKEMCYVKTSEYVTSDDFDPKVFEIIEAIKKEHKLLSVEQTLKCVKNNALFINSTDKIVF